MSDYMYVKYDFLWLPWIQTQYKNKSMLFKASLAEETVVFDLDLTNNDTSDSHKSKVSTDQCREMGHKSMVITVLLVYYPQTFTN